VRHLELLSNFMLEAAASLDTSRDVSVNLMRTIMPVVLSAPYLLLEALAISALHLSQFRPEQSDSYRMDATSLQIEALTSFDDHIGNINNGNCAAMLMFAGFLGIHSLADAVIASRNDADGFLDRFIIYLNLHRGVKMVTSQAWAMLLTSNISPVLQQASDHLKLAASQEPLQASFMADELNRLLDIADLCEESNAACRDAVSTLKMIYQADHVGNQSLEAQQHSPGLVWAWPSLLTGTYTDLLQRRQPEALIILCYFAVLLHRRRSMWCVDCAGRLLIESVTKSLGSYWRPWLDWPNEIIESNSMQ
jgi:hypothetical protein